MYNLNSCLEVGDIILIRGGKIHSKAIARVTGGHYSHTCLCINERTIIEAITSTGVQYSSVVRFAFMKKENVAILRPNFPDEHSKVLFQETIQRLASHDLGKGYDYSGAATSLSDKAGENEEEKFFCSQLVASLFKRADFPLFDAPSNKINPNQYIHNEKLNNITDIVLSEIPEYVLERCKRRGEKVNFLDSSGSSRSESHSLLSDYFKAVEPVFKKHRITPPKNIPEAIFILTDPYTLAISMKIDKRISKQFERMKIIEKLEIWSDEKGDDLEYLDHEIAKYGSDFIAEETTACLVFIEQARNSKDRIEASLCACREASDKLKLCFFRKAIEYYEMNMRHADHAIASEQAILDVLQNHIETDSVN